MEHLIIGTAGHIDHGKTAMIRALTGRDTDTLKEEKKRGISIDLGFTYFELPDGKRAGVIDVPGHEKFLPNMLAGVCGIDLVLLVIALDEGIMPQTREHMDILEKLQVPGGILVLTKEDSVEKEWADMMEEEIREGIKGTMFASWPVQRISAVTGMGVEVLKEKIIQKALEIQRNRNTTGRFRLPIDRVMSLKGLGTVIAGTVMEGTIYRDETIMLYPSGQTGKIRSIQVHGSDEEKASAGQRAAFLLAGIKKEEVKRGFVAAFPDSLKLSRFLDVKIEMVTDTERVIKNQTRLHLHIGASEVLCRAVLLDRQELAPGECGYAQLILEQEIAVKKKDRFILRFFSPLETIGGGFVLEEQPQKHKRFDGNVLSLLKNKEEDKECEVVLSVLETGFGNNSRIRENRGKSGEGADNGNGRPMGAGELELLTGIGRQELIRILDELEAGQQCAAVRGKKKTFYWTPEAEEKEMHRFCNCLGEYHRKWPFKKGIEKNILKGLLWKRWEADRFDAWLEDLEEKEIIQRKGTLIWKAEFIPVASPLSERTLKKLIKAYEKAGFDFVNKKDLKPPSMDAEMYEDLLGFLTDRGDIVRINDDFYTTPKLAEEMIQRVQNYFQEKEVLSFASLRDLLGSSRRSAKPVMAYLDEQNITAWCGKETERIKKGD